MASQKPVPGASGPASSEAESFESIAHRMLKDALALHAEERSLATREIRECVKSLASQAKARGAKAEQMLIELKQTWYAIAESGAHPKSEVISRLVTMCIHEFYGVDPESSDG